MLRNAARYRPLPLHQPSELAFSPVGSVCVRCRVRSTAVNAMMSTKAKAKAKAKAELTLKQKKKAALKRDMAAMFGVARKNKLAMKAAAQAAAELGETGETSKRTAQNPTEEGQGTNIKQAINGLSVEDALKQRGTVVREAERGVNPDSQEVQPVEIEGQHEVRRLQHGLDRVLFNPGVFWLQDPRSRIFNFDPYLQKIMPVTEFDFEAIASYITSSKDTTLTDLARKHGKKYIGSTSSMTGALSHFHFLISSWRPLNFDVVSRSFATKLTNFTAITRMPTSIFLRYKGDGVYAIDADKEFDTESILSLLGQSMEKFLTLPKEQYEKYRLENSHQLEQHDRNRPETYHYSTFGDFLMRSQLDAQDPRLPGSGMFDLKTRAVVSVRMDAQNAHIGAGYQIKSRHGNFESFEREYFDMIRSAFLKYSLQARMGRMDGIYVTFHNTEKIFGFQYIPLDEMDNTIHGGPNIGHKEFKLSLQLLNKLLDRATTKYPEQSLRLFFEARPTQTPLMYVFAEPMSEAEIEEVQKGERGDVQDFLKELGEKMRCRVPEEIAGNPPAAEETSSAEPEHLGGEMSIDNFTLAEGVEKAVLSGEQTDGDMPAERIPESSTSDLTSGVLSAADSTAENPSVEEERDATPADFAVGFEMDPSSPELQEDAAFLDSLEKEVEGTGAEDKEILGFTLTTKSSVNGRNVLRPVALTPEDKWEVEYAIAEIKSRARAWSIYEAVKSRRVKSLLRTQDADAGGIRPDDINPFLKKLQELSEEGRRWEAEWVEKDKDRTPTLFESHNGQ